MTFQYLSILFRLIHIRYSLDFAWSHMWARLRLCWWRSECIQMPDGNSKLKLYAKNMFHCDSLFYLFSLPFEIGDRGECLEHQLFLYVANDFNCLVSYVLMSIEPNTPLFFLNTTHGTPNTNNRSMSMAVSSYPWALQLYGFSLSSTWPSIFMIQNFKKQDFEERSPNGFT